MQRFDVQIALEGVNEARTAWLGKYREFNATTDKIMKRLLHEAAANFMSAEDVAKHSGFTVKRVREMMRTHGLDPKSGKRVLSKRAADALNGNAELLGIRPHDMDLMSPLAYLPMGKELRQQITDASISKVTEDPVVEVAYLLWQFNQVGYIRAADRAVVENWMYDDPKTMHPDDAKALPGWLDAAREVIRIVSGNPA